MVDCHGEKITKHFDQYGSHDDKKFDESSQKWRSQNAIEKNCTVHFIFLMLPQIHKITPMKKKYSWWISCRSCWSGQSFSSTSHLMFFVAMHWGKKLMSSHAAFMASNRDFWSCGLYDHILSTSMLKKTLLLDLGMEIMVKRTPLLSFHVQQTSSSQCWFGGSWHYPRQQHN